MKALAQRPPGEVRVFMEYASFHVWEEPTREEMQANWPQYDKGFEYDILHPIIRLLRRRGWSVRQDKNILKHHRCLRNGHRHCKHPSGGKYEHDKLRKMPYLLKVRVKYEIQQFVAWCRENTEYTYKDSKPKYGALDATVDEFLDYRAEHETFGRGRSVYNNAEISPYNSKGQDGVIRNGERVFFLGWDKRWGVGIAEHNINNMWWVKVGTHGLNNIGSHELRHTVPEGGLRGRHISEGARMKRLETLMLQAAKERRYADAERMRAVFDMKLEQQQDKEQEAILQKEVQCA